MDRRGIQSKWHELKFSRVIAEMDGYHRHLDLGCGPGTLIGLLDDRFISTGIDISTAEIDYAHGQYGSERKRFFALSARGLPEDCRDCDVATVVEVIEHLAPAELDDVLRATVARLRPGGKLVVTTPNFHSAWPLVQMLVNHLGELNYAPQHINRFTPPRVRQLLQDLGLEDSCPRRAPGGGYRIKAPRTQTLDRELVAHSKETAMAVPRDTLIRLVR
ncbi:MAG: class I SAM-dependent methyltransferase [Solirubrobacterales bacterium]|nr:class I SAM-dependent methyltransferase [Solirubrobacterales bacterium]